MYDDLENEDSGGERQTNNNSNLGSTVGGRSVIAKSSFGTKIKGNYFGDDDEVQSDLGRNMHLHTIRASDTRLPDDVSSVSDAFESIRDSVTGGSATGGPVRSCNNRSQAGSDKRARTGDHVAPAFLPLSSNKLPSGGFQYQKVKNTFSSGRTWDALDPYAQEIIDGSKACENTQPSTNPYHPSNAPLAAVFGNMNVKTAIDNPTVLTSENLDTLNYEVPGVLGGNMGATSDIAWSNDGSSPSGRPPSRPSLKTLGSSNRPSQNGSADSLIYETGSVSSDRTVGPPSSEIHPNVRVNFASYEDVVTNRAPMTIAERANDDWAGASVASASGIVNQFGDGNAVKVQAAMEMRVMDWDEHGNYKGEFKGFVKKRIRRGFIDAIHKLESEMIQASQIYLELCEMIPAERLAALTAMRKPIALWASGPGAADADIFETEDLPAIYKKRWDAKKARRERLDRILKAKATSRSQANYSSQSGRSQQTEVSVSIVGRLGDLDGPLPSGRAHHSVSGTQFSSRNSLPTVKRMSERAVKAAKSSRQSQQRAASRHGSVSSRSRSSSSTITQQSGGVRVGGNYRLSTGYSVAGPRSTASQDDWPALGAQPAMESQQSSHHSSRGTSSATHRGVNGTGSDRTDFAALLEYDDSPLLADPSDVAFPHQDPLDPTMEMLKKAAMDQSKNRGRAVVVRLHATVTFSGDALAKRIFGGIIQEFQLHPDQHAAVVIFVHPVEARSFLKHVMNVRENGTGQEIRELQIEAAWYNGREESSITPAQLNMMTYHVGLGATRALKIHNVHPSKLYKDVAHDLNQHFGEQLVMFMTLQAPVENHKLAVEGRQAIIEFASLGDAINAYLDFKTGLYAGYEDARPEFVQERSAKQAHDKKWCDCLGCDERKKDREGRRAAKIKELRDQRDNRGARASTRASTSRSASAQQSSMVGSSGARGSTNESTASAQGEETDTEGNLMEFSDREVDKEIEEEDTAHWGF